MAYSLLPGFRVRVKGRAAYDHWQGGPILQSSAVCPTCDRPFLLLWNINCRDPRFQVRGRPIFKDLVRLPLYYCWACVAEMDYRLTATNQIELLSYVGRPQGRNFPYPRYPRAFPRLPIALDPLAGMPAPVRKLLVNCSMTQRFSAKEQRVLANWIGHPLKLGFDVWWHQFGGDPWLVQGSEKIHCPNKSCSWSKRGWPMKILAAMRNDPPGGLPMVESEKQVKRIQGGYNNFVQVIFHICRGCLTVHAGNRCD